MGWDPTLDFRFFQIILSEEVDSDHFLEKLYPINFWNFTSDLSNVVQTFKIFM